MLRYTLWVACKTLYDFVIGLFRPIIDWVLALSILLAYFALTTSQQMAAPQAVSQSIESLATNYIALKSGIILQPEQSRINWNRSQKLVNIDWENVTVSGNRVDGKIARISTIFSYSFFERTLDLKELALSSPKLTFKELRQSQNNSDPNLPEIITVRDGDFYYKGHHVSLTKATLKQGTQNFDLSGFYKTVDIHIPFVTTGNLAQKVATVKTTVGTYKKQTVPPLIFKITDPQALTDPKAITQIALEKPFSASFSLKNPRTVTATIPQLTTQQLQSISPKESKVLRQYVPAATYKNVRLDFTEQNIRVRTNVEKATIVYDDKFPPITGYKGTAVFENGNISSQGQGTIKDLAIDGNISIQNKQVKGTVIINGPLKSQIILAKNEPDVRQALKDLNMQSLAGTAKTTVTLNGQNISIASKIIKAQLTVPGTNYVFNNINGTFLSNIKSPKFTGTATLNTIPVSVEFTPSKSIIKILKPAATKQLIEFAGFKAGQKYVSGNSNFTVLYGKDLQVELDLKDTAIDINTINWQKPKGQPAVLEINDKTLAFRSGLEKFSGTIVDKGIVLKDLKLAENKIKELKIVDNNIVLLAEQLDLSQAAAGTSDNNNIYSFMATVDHVKLKNNVALKDFNARGNTKNFSLNAVLNEKSISFNKQHDIFTLKATDAESFLSALNVTNHIKGGTLVFKGTYNESLQGNLEIKDFRIVKMPLLTKILAAGSITGPLEMLTGRGIAFQRLAGTITYNTDELILKDAHMLGSGLGLHTQGTIFLTQQEVDLNGTIVPFNMINSAVKDIPILGQILTGQKGEGIIALTYRAKGNLDNPEVRINPLSALAPGFLRRIFE